jgi:hypothetical protein
MKRFLWSFAALALIAGLAACGGDDDDDSSSGSSSSSASTAEADDESAATGDFCDVWSEVNSDESTLTDEPTEEQIAEARDAIEQVRELAPEEIEDEVTQIADAIEGLLDKVAAGGDIDTEEAFGELFALAFSAGPPIEAWMVDNCPDYDPSSFGVEEDDGTGVLGIPQGDLDEIRFAAVVDDQGASSSSSGDDHEWTIYFVGSIDDAVAACEQVSEAVASHPDASGTLSLSIASAEERVFASNAAITAGDPGTCEAGLEG